MLYQKRKQKSKITSEVLRRTILSLGFEDKIPMRSSLSYTNDVFKIFDKNQVYFLKFFTDQWCDPKVGVREIEAAKILRNQGINVPNALFFSYANSIIPRNWCLYESLPGKPLKFGLPGEVSEIVMFETIDLLERMEKITGNLGFIMHDEKVHKTYSTHFDFINDTVWYALKKVSDFGYNIKNIPVLFEQCKKYDIKENFSFCHNDFTPKHILINNKVTGLLDFEWAIFGDSISDIALWTTSLAEFGASENNVKFVMDYGLSKSSQEKFSYFVARKLILAAAWPHKQVQQPYYSQTCLDKAETVLLNKSVSLEQIIWKKCLGVLE